MKPSTISPKLQKLLAAAFWLAVWQAASMLAGYDFLLASPLAVLRKLWELLQSPAFYRAAAFTSWRVLCGYLLGVLCAVVFAALAKRFSLVRVLLSPFIVTIRTVPVASFVILALILMSSRNLSILISFLIAFPVLYAGLLSALDNADRRLDEMARVFRLPFARRVTRVLMPQILPAFSTACVTALGLAWKSGVAAEVIGYPRGSIGDRLYQAKITLQTPELFAWTLVIVLISLLMEKLMRLGLSALNKAIAGR